MASVGPMLQISVALERTARRTAKFVFPTENAALMVRISAALEPIVRQTAKFALAMVIADPTVLTSASRIDRGADSPVGTSVLLVVVQFFL